MRNLLFQGCVAFSFFGAAEAHAQLSAGAPATCELGENIGVAPADAQVASRIVCAEVLQQARRASREAPYAYRVHLGKLGTRVLLRVTEHANGVDVNDQRQSSLDGVEDVSGISRRLAESLVTKKTMASLESTENIAPEEARVPRVKEGLASVEIGLAGTMLAGDQTSEVAPGLRGALSYHMKRSYITASTRFGVARDAALIDASIGGGAHLSDKDIAPYVGAGIAYLSMSDELLGTGHSGSGFAPYAEVGASVFRTSRTGLRVGLRADIPMFKMEGKQGLVLVADTGNPLPSPIYQVPISLSVSMALF